MEFNNEKVIYLEDIDFDNKGNLVSDIDQPIVVMIYGSQCPHCHNAIPDYIELSKKSDITTAAIITDGPFADSKLLNRLSKIIPNVQGVPTFALFRNGRYIKTHSGERKASLLENFAKT